MVEPTWQWVVERGRARKEPKAMTTAAPSSIANPREGVTLTIFTPRAEIILYP